MISVRLKEIWNNTVKNKDLIRKSLFLLSSTILGLLFGFITNTLLTRLLGKESFGDYALIINIFTFCQIVFNFGLYYTLSRLVAIATSQEKVRGYYSVGAILSIGLFILMGVSLYIYSYFSNNIKDNNLQVIFTIAIPFSWIFLFTSLNEYFLQGDNKISLLSISRIVPKIIFALILSYFFLVNINIDVLWVLLFNYFSLFVTYFWVFLKVKPHRLRLRRRFNEIVVGVKRFGFDIYLGSLIASGSGSLSGILIGHFSINNVEVGYFTLATLLSSPLSIIPNIIATVQFKQFALLTKIPREAIVVTFSLCLIVLLCIWFLSELLVNLIFGIEYVETIVILKYLSIGYLLYGIGDFYNRFLLAKGKGRELRNASIIVGVTLLTANVFLIKFMGGTGAAIARIVSGFTYTLVILYYYKKEIRR